MIVKRGNKKRGVRTIVKRNRPTVGQKRATIVRRQSSVVPPKGPGAFSRMLGWRPGRGFYAGLVVVALLTLTGSAVAWAWTTPFFEVNNIKVEGTARLDTADIAAQTDLFGERMFTADLAEAQRALYQLPLVSSVEVAREWPDTIRVTVVEREAWGTWVQEGLSYTIDRDGVVIGANAGPAGAPVIVSETSGRLGLGDRVNYQAVDAAAEIYERLPRQLGTTVAEIRFLGPGGVQVSTADGRIGYLGDSGSMSYKLAAWAATAAEAERRGIDYTSIDLRYGNRPVLQ